MSTSRTKGALVNKIIDQYKNSKNSLIISFVPNRVYCLSGYWIEYINPGTFTLLFYEKTKRSINKYKEAKQEVDEFIRDINSEYKSIRKEIKDLFKKLCSRVKRLFIKYVSPFLYCENNKNKKSKN